MNPKFGRRNPAFWMIKRIISWILFPYVNRPQWTSNSQISLKTNRIIEVTFACFHILFIFGMSKTLVPFKGTCWCFFPHPQAKVTEVGGERRAGGSNLSRHVDPRWKYWLRICGSNDNWLVVWNMNFIFPYIGKNHPIWLIFFRGVGIPPIR